MGEEEEEELVDMPRVVGILSALLERVVERNDAAADELAAGDAHELAELVVAVRTLRGLRRG